MKTNFSWKNGSINFLASICFLSGSYILFIKFGLYAAIGVGLEVLSVYISMQGGWGLSSKKEKSEGTKNPK